MGGREIAEDCFEVFFIDFYQFVLSGVTNNRVFSGIILTGNYELFEADSLPEFTLNNANLIPHMVALYISIRTFLPFF